MKEIVIATLCVLGFIVLIGIVGTQERADEIVYSLPAELVNHIESKGYVTTKEIASEYMSHKAIYDAMCDDNYW